MKRVDGEGEKPRRAVFLDRDGVICRNRVDHVKSWDEFVFLSRAREALARLAYLDLAIVVVTNQAAINRGLVTEETVDDIHARMRSEIALSGGRVDGVYYCPHRPDEGCGCRKPEPGMLLRAALDLDIELRGSYLVGDAWSDVQAALAVGCVPYFVMTGRAGQQAPEAFRQGAGRFRVVADLSEAVTAILQSEGCSPYEMAWSRTLAAKNGPLPQPRFSSRAGNRYPVETIPSLDDPHSPTSSASEQPKAGICR